MIHYDGRGFYLFVNLLRSRGSVFPASLLVAIPSALLAYLLSSLVKGGRLDYFKLEKESVLSDNAAFSGFSFLVGFLIVFRTSQSYNRFWDGCTSTHQMRAEWFDGCSSLIAFTKHSTAAEEKISLFKNTLVRLFSMLHAAALADIEDSSKTDLSTVKAFHFEIIDIGVFDIDSLRCIQESNAKVELIFQWIQQLVVENISTGVLSIPPPILSRSFQEVANGMVMFHDAMKIATIPFPFPYAQACDFLLVMHWIIAPVVVTQWVSEPWFAGMFTFVQVFILWSLNFIALQLENPYGQDDNDIDAEHMQEECNLHLLMLLRPSTARTPRIQLKRHGVIDLTQGVHYSLEGRLILKSDIRSFNDVWKRCDELVEDVSREEHADTPAMSECDTPCTEGVQHRLSAKSRESAKAPHTKSFGSQETVGQFNRRFVSHGRKSARKHTPVALPGARQVLVKSGSRRFLASSPSEEFPDHREHHVSELLFASPESPNEDLVGSSDLNESANTAVAQHRVQTEQVPTSSQKGRSEPDMISCEPSKGSPLLSPVPDIGNREEPASVSLSKSKDVTAAVDEVQISMRMVEYLAQIAKGIEMLSVSTSMHDPNLAGFFYPDGNGNHTITEMPPSSAPLVSYPPNARAHPARLVEMRGGNHGPSSTLPCCTGLLWRPESSRESAQSRSN